MHISQEGLEGEHSFLWKQGIDIYVEIIYIKVIAALAVTLTSVVCCGSKSQAGMALGELAHPQFSTILSLWSHIGSRSGQTSIGIVVFDPCPGEFWICTEYMGAFRTTDSKTIGFSYQIWYLIKYGWRLPLASNWRQTEQTSKLTSNLASNCWTETSKLDASKVGSRQVDTAAVQR